MVILVHVFSEFVEWKDHIQNKTFTSYVLDTAPKILSNGDKKRYFNCHRSHEFKTKSKNLRRMKNGNTNKIGAACPARLEVITVNNTEAIKIKYWKTHLGHSSDIGRTYLSKSDRIQIAGTII